MSEQPIIFYDWPYSPFCMKVRAMLDHKRVEYRTVNPLAARGRLRRRGTGKVPAIELDGAFITDSTDIAYALDERFPDPPLLPAGERERGLCHVVEDWADESLYFIGLYYRWFDRAGRAEIPAKFGRSMKGRLAYSVAQNQTGPQALLSPANRPLPLLRRNQPQLILVSR